MQVGTVKEIKAHEYRVGLTPSCARAYTARGHKVVVESGAGSNTGFSDAEYAAAGAVIETDRKRIFDTCEMIIKVKAIAYETIETEDRSLPCLTPMSEIAGRLSVQEGAKYLEKTCKKYPPNSPKESIFTWETVSIITSHRTSNYPINPSNYPINPSMKQ